MYGHAVAIGITSTPQNRGPLRSQAIRVKMYILAHGSTYSGKQDFGRKTDESEVRSHL